MILSVFQILVLLGLLPAPLQEARPVPPAQRPAPAVRKTYNDTADAKALIATAVKAAAEDDIRVLIQWGTNDDERCTAFTKMQRDPSFAKQRLLSIEYKLVSVDVGRADRNRELADGYGAKLDAGTLPYLTILDRDGKVVAQAASPEFTSTADPVAFDPGKVADFLNRYKTKAPDPQPMFDAALAEARKEDKYVFLWFSAPW